MSTVSRKNNIDFGAVNNLCQVLYSMFSVNNLSLYDVNNKDMINIIDCLKNVNAVETPEYGSIIDDNNEKIRKGGLSLKDYPPASATIMKSLVHDLVCLCLFEQDSNTKHFIDQLIIRYDIYVKIVDKYAEEYKNRNSGNDLINSIIETNLKANTKKHDSYKGKEAEELLNDYTKIIKALSVMIFREYYILDKAFTVGSLARLRDILLVENIILPTGSVLKCFEDLIIENQNKPKRTTTTKSTKTTKTTKVDNEIVPVSNEEINDLI